MRLLGAPLRRAVGAKQVYLEGRTLRDLLGRLVARGGDELARRVYLDPETPEPTTHPDLRLLVNGRNARFLDGLDTSLREKDVVTVHFAGARSFPGG